MHAVIPRRFVIKNNFNSFSDKASNGRSQNAQMQPIITPRLHRREGVVCILSVYCFAINTADSADSRQCVRRCLLVLVDWHSVERIRGVRGIVPVHVHCRDVIRSVGFDGCADRKVVTFDGIIDLHGAVQIAQGTLCVAMLQLVVFEVS